MLVTHRGRLNSQLGLVNALIANGHVELATHLLKEVVEMQTANTPTSQLAVELDLINAYIVNGQEKEAMELVGQLFSVDSQGC